MIITKSLEFQRWQIWQNNAQGEEKKEGNCYTASVSSRSSATAGVTTYCYCLLCSNEWHNEKKRKLKQSNVKQKKVKRSTQMHATNIFIKFMIFASYYPLTSLQGGRNDRKKRSKRRKKEKKSPHSRTSHYNFFMTM